MIGDIVMELMKAIQLTGPCEIDVVREAYQDIAVGKHTGKKIVVLL